MESQEQQNHIFSFRHRERHGTNAPLRDESPAVEIDPCWVPQGPRPPCRVDVAGSAEPEDFLSNRNFQRPANPVPVSQNRRPEAPRTEGLAQGYTVSNSSPDPSLGIMSPEEPVGPFSRLLSRVSKDSSPFFQRVARHFQPPSPLASGICDMMPEPGSGLGSQSVPQDIMGQ